MTRSEIKLAIDMLDSYSEVLGEAGCNDYDLSEIVPDHQERNDMVLGFHIWNGDEDEYEPASLEEKRDYRMPDFVVCGYLVARLKEELDAINNSTTA